MKFIMIYFNQQKERGTKIRIEKREMIFLSQKEAETWTGFQQILEEIERNSNNQNVLYYVGEIIGHMSDLWEEIADVD